MDDLLALLAYPFVAAIIFVGMHTWLGLQVLRRNVVFADLALAQLAALGATVAVALGHAPGDAGAFGYAVLATLFGALVLTGTRRIAETVSQEAVIGILYVVATAVTVLVVDRSPQGAEHVKRMLVGSILTIGPADVAKLAIVYSTVAALHALCRGPLLAATQEQPGARPPAQWDFLFYGTFGIVVTSSVAYAGVLLVFSFLIIPAVIGTLFSARLGAALAVGWIAGVLASSLGFAASVGFDLPTGAAMVAAFAAVLLGSVPIRILLVSSRPERAARRRRLAAFAGCAVGLALLGQGAWLMVAPGADQPLLAALERVSVLGPERFLTSAEQAAYVEAREYEERHRRTVDELGSAERSARWSNDQLSEEDVRKIASLQQTFNEMGRGERFVQEHLRAEARKRERWIVGLPTTFLGALLLIVFGQFRRERPQRGTEPAGLESIATSSVGNVHRGSVSRVRPIRPGA